MQQSTCFLRFFSKLFLILNQSTYFRSKSGYSTSTRRDLACVGDPIVFSSQIRMTKGFITNKVEEKYIPSSLDIGKTLGDYIQLKSGLTNDLAQIHHNLVGPNILPLTPPSLFIGVDMVPILVLLYGTREYSCTDNRWTCSCYVSIYE